jgi:hypothetical protein
VATGTAVTLKTIILEVSARIWAYDILCGVMNIVILIILNPRECKPLEPSNAPREVKAVFDLVPCCKLLFIPAIKIDISGSILTKFDYACY